jgi:hypothetical protein
MIALGEWVALDDGQEAQVSWPADDEGLTVGVLTTEGRILYPRVESLRPIPEPAS